MKLMISSLLRPLFTLQKDRPPSTSGLQFLTANPTKTILDKPCCKAAGRRPAHADNSGTSAQRKAIADRHGRPACSHGLEGLRGMRNPIRTSRSLSPCKVRVCLLADGLCRVDSNGESNGDSNSSDQRRPATAHNTRTIQRNQGH